MRYFLTSFLIVYTIQLWAQANENLVGLKSWQVLDFAKAAEREGDLYSAIDYYEFHYKIKPEREATVFKLGELYLKTRNYEKAESTLKKMFSFNTDKFPLTFYFLAQSQMQQAKYSDAVKNFELFLKKSKSSDEAKMHKGIAQIQLQACQNAPKLKDSTTNVVLTHLHQSINKAHVESNPIWVDDQTMWYNSLRADEVEYFPVNDSTGLPKRKFYSASKKGQEWQYTDSLPFFNDAKNDVGNGAFSVDKQRFYFTKCALNWKNEMICHIWVSQKKGASWTEPIQLNSNVNVEGYFSTQPTLGTDISTGEEVMYFVSNRPGTKGYSDLWFAVYNSKKKEFKKAKRLNNSINTNGSEYTPYYDNASRNLYFSSDAFWGLGGYDVYKTTGSLNQWLAPVNLGAPINSSTDDIYFVINPNRKEGFFVSNREGGVSLKSKTCCDDIYEYIFSEFIDIQFVGTLIAKKDQSFFRIINEKMGLKIVDQNVDSIYTSLSLFDEKNGQSIEINSNYTDSLGNCHYNLEVNKDYEMKVNNFGYFEKLIKISTQGIKTSTVLRDTIIINTIPQEPIPINIYYEFDQSTLTKQAMATIDSTLLIVLEEIPNVTVEISSHTDSKGIDEYNKELSQKRAESVVKYLVKKGIDKARLVAKGYGEEIPVAANENPDGTDNPEGRDKNRRTEFRFINIKSGAEDSE